MKNKDSVRENGASSTFELYALRFRYTASSIGDWNLNTLRGAFGAALRSIDYEAYQRLFAPKSSSTPSGYADPPRPFVFRLHGPLNVGVNLFTTRDPAVEMFVRVMGELGKMESITGTEVLSLSLDPPDRDVPRLRVRFVTPTELKGADQPDFGILMRRVRDRISMLRALYGEGPLLLDFAGFGERADRAAMTRCDLEHVKAERVSRNTGQRHPIGGFVGIAEYEGELAEFVPFLEAAQWTGVGRQTVWGKGEIAVEEI